MKYCIFKHKVINLILIFLLFNIPHLFAQTNILPLNKIKPGMKGYGLTVFKGIKIEKFDVEIISVLRNIRPNSGLILAKIKNKIIDKTGIIAGMSGSPIYINNKLIGALAFSWSFSKEAIAGITPIEDMLKIFKFSNQKHSFNFEPKNKEYVWINPRNGIQTIKTPLVFQGISQQTIDLFYDKLTKMNFLPIAGGGINASPNEYEIPKKFQPGSAVGINLITGDLNLSAIGTVTYVNKNKILIFGHPMFYSGTSDLPLSYAYIHTVLPSLYVSFKIGTSTKVVGRIYQDQLAGCAGILNQMPKLIPVSVGIKFFNQQNTYHYNIIRSYHYLPTFLMLAIFRSMEMIGGWDEKNTLSFNFIIKFNNNKKITLKNTLSALSTRETMVNSMLYLLSPLSYLLENKFENVQINNITANIEISEKIRVAEIKKIIAPKKTFKPGETLKLKVEIKPYKQKSFFKTINIKIPKNLKQKRLIIVVSSDMERQYIDYLLTPIKYQPQSMNHLIHLYNTLAKSTDLSIWAIVRNKSLVINDSVLENLPSSYYYLFQNSLETGAQRNIMQIKNKISLNYVITGASMLPIEIKKELEN